MNNTQQEYIDRIQDELMINDSPVCDGTYQWATVIMLSVKIESIDVEEMKNRNLMNMN